MEESGLGIFESVIYGLLQGLTEFLPVSSSGHLAMAHLLVWGLCPKPRITIRCPAACGHFGGNRACFLA